jgi:uncharacterized protein
MGLLISGGLTTSPRQWRRSMKPSAYNFAFPTDSGSWLLFNARTGKMLDLTGPQASRLATSLTGQADDEEIAVDGESLHTLTSQEFVIEDAFDELAAIRSTYWKARTEAPAVVTITTTLDCNLGCFYCYEERSADSLQIEDLPTILLRIQSLLQGSTRKTLHVDWYGGEPTLNLPFLESASSAIQDLCSSLGVRYSASIISNGTAWPEDVEAFIQRHRIRQAQITFDGMRAHHNRRRRFTQSADSERSSFDEASALISRLVDVCRVDIRYNVDHLNADDFVPFVQFAEAQGWFGAKFQATFQPARVAAYTEKSRFVEKIGLTDDEFHRLKRQVAPLLPPQAMVEPETPSGYAAPKTSVCAALSNHAIVIGADRRLYRCGLQVSEPQRAVGPLAARAFRILDNESGASDESWWAEFDPTKLPTCSVCSFLPICLGSCPKKQLEGDKATLDAQSLYWRTHLARLICKTAHIPEVGWQFTEQDQFRLRPSADPVPTDEVPVLSSSI